MYNKMIRKYIERLKANRGFSDNTCKNYNRTMVRFDKYLKKISLNTRGANNCEKIRLSLIDSYIKSQRLAGKDVRTCNNYLACIKLYLRFCLINDKEVEDYRKVMFAREPKKKIDALTDEEVKRLFKYFRTQTPKGKYGELIKTRNLVILQLLIYTGLRVSELSNLKVSDIKEEVQIIGKGGRRRVVNLYKDDLELIDLYLYMRRNIDSEYLFISLAPNCIGKRLSNVSIENIIRDGGKAAGINKKVFPHLLRHTFATNLLKGKASIYHIQQLLGHSSLATTQTYLTAFNDELRHTQKLCHKY
jgi:integrase/recombinase XerD